MLVQSIFSHAQLEPLTMLKTIQNLIGDFLAFLETSTAFGNVTHQCGAQALECCTFNDTELFVQVLANFVQLGFFNRQCTSVTLNAVASENLNVNDSAFGTSRHTQGSVFNVAGFFTEDCAQQLLFWSQLRLTFRCHFTNQNVAWADFSTHVNDTGLIQFIQRSFAHVRDVCSDFFWTKLGVTSHTGQFLNVDRGETVFLNYTFRQTDGVFEVEAVPCHEGNTHVLTQSQLTHVGGRAISHDVATLNPITFANQRTLVDAGVLVRACVLGQVVDVDTGFTGFNFVICNTNNDATSIYGVNNATTTGYYTNPGVTRYVTLHACTHQRLVSTQCRYSLTLHVRTHQCTVGIVMLEERNQRRSNRNYLFRRHVHQGDVFRRLNSELIQVTYSYQLIDQDFLIVHGG